MYVLGADISTFKEEIIFTDRFRLDGNHIFYVYDYICLFYYFFKERPLLSFLS